jgi:hypothetical protein
MSDARFLTTATTLKNKEVLIVGGLGGASTGLNTAELFNPKSRKFSPTGSLASARFNHSATLLKDGVVLIAGGCNGAILDSAEVYDPKTGKFSSIGSMTTLRS